MVRKILKYGILLVFIIFILGALSGKKKDNTQNIVTKNPQVPISIKDTSRSFHLGFTRWPPSFEAADIEHMYQFIAEHGDLIAHHFDAGVPWPEAYDDQPFSKHVMDDWSFSKSKTPKGHKVYVAITPLADSRDAMAKYLGSSDNMTIPSPWNGYALNDEHVKRAYLNYARRVVDYYHPDYLAIGIEVNVALTKDRAAWDAYKDLHKYTYQELKKIYPELPIFASFSLSHMEGLESGSEKRMQEQEIRSLLPYLDYMGLSAYPYGFAYKGGKLAPVPDSYFDTAISFGKPIAVGETGMPSANFSAFLMTWEFTQDEQTQYIDMLLHAAERNKFVFVTNWAAVDFDKLVKLFPPIARDFASFFVYTGLEKSDGSPKSALAKWDAYRALPFR